MLGAELAKYYEKLKELEETHPEIGSLLTMLTIRVDELEERFLEHEKERGESRMTGNLGFSMFGELKMGAPQLGLSYGQIKDFASQRPFRSFGMPLEETLSRCPVYLYDNLIGHFEQNSEKKWKLGSDLASKLRIETEFSSDELGTLHALLVKELESKGGVENCELWMKGKQLEAQAIDASNACKSMLESTYPEIVRSNCSKAKNVQTVCDLLRKVEELAKGIRENLELCGQDKKKD